MYIETSLLENNMDEFKRFIKFRYKGNDIIIDKKLDNEITMCLVGRRDNKCYVTSYDKETADIIIARGYVGDLMLYKNIKIDLQKMKSFAQNSLKKEINTLKRVIEEKEKLYFSKYGNN